MSSMGLTSAIISCIVVITFIALFAFVIPYLYDQNLKSDQTHSNYCSLLYIAIQQDKQIQEKQNITINEQNLYSQSCSN